MLTGWNRQRRGVPHPTGGPSTGPPPRSRVRNFSDRVWGDFGDPCHHGPRWPRSAFDKHIGHRRHYDRDSLAAVLTRPDSPTSTSRPRASRSSTSTSWSSSLRGKRLITDVQGDASVVRGGGSAMRDRSTGCSRSRRHRGRFGWQIVATATSPVSPCSAQMLFELGETGRRSDLVEALERLVAGQSSLAAESSPWTSAGRTCSGRHGLDDRAASKIDRPVVDDVEPDAPGSAMPFS